MRKKLLISALLITVALGLAGCGIIKNANKNITADQAKTIATDFINKNLVSEGTTVTIDTVTEENGLYKLAVKLSTGSSVDSYMTKDGTKFFTQALDIAQIEQENTNTNSASNTNSAATQTTTKSDKPVVELFVMSHCPYGTQIEKGIIPAVQALGDKISFEIKFCDYSMHGDKELSEELNQVCIKKIASASYLTYLQCFLKSSDGAACLKTAKIDTTKLSACVKEVDDKYSVTKNAKDKTTWVSSQYPAFNVYKDDNTKYNIQGSPTLIINGVEADSARDSASLLKTICSSFNTVPSECSAKLSSTAPAAGFGDGTTTSTTSASCTN